jgi:hypothetical protein
MENLRKHLSKLGIAAARKRGNFTVKIAGQAIAVYEGSFTITQDIKPDDAADAVAIGLTHLIFNQALRK